jgi:hypothetical protein
VFPRWLERTDGRVESQTTERGPQRREICAQFIEAQVGTWSVGDVILPEVGAELGIVLVTIASSPMLISSRARGCQEMKPGFPPPCSLGMDGNGVSIGVREHERPAKWTIEGLSENLKPSMNQPIMQSLVERQQSSSNARILNAHLTSAGRRKWQSVDDGVQELEERLLRGLTQDEVRVLNRSLETIIRNMTPTP